MNKLNKLTNIQPVVEVRHLTKRIRTRSIVDQITFDLFPGEVFGFLGPNGAGKTTTIRMMVGLIGMSDGDVTINGYSIRTSFREAIQHVGAIIENPELYKHLTGMQNLKQFARMVEGIPQSRIDQIVQLVGLTARIHDKVKTYSLGMRQRLGIAQALLHKPAVLILDEPTNGLDPAGIREMRQLVRKMAAEEGIAVMVSSHLLAEMEQMCDRFGVVIDGRLRTTFSLADLQSQTDSQTLEETYIRLTEVANYA
ncbi:ABC-2 type transport system ATP-binding protein [Paenibacillus qinlingensis]|uniref:ABC-2 type transport system ATP-binding protein n=1 Tax=Paenibacillus qinlingensis TaxID=1837343 RepID=A0ABU1NYS6_9BACL|nr:ABC-2 type transport system ATP-binding protein [Paenibacillus qinlingensis]